MSFFGSTKKPKLDKPKDSVGGFGPTASDVYPITITAAYGVSSTKSDAQAVRLEAKETGGNRKFYKTLWITNAEGKVTSEKDGKQKYLTGYLMADALAMIATEGEYGILELETEEKTIKVKRDGKEVNETVDSFPELIGAKFQLGIIDTMKFKQNNVDGKYEDTDEVVHEAEWAVIFDEDGFTLNELEDEKQDPEFIEEWLKTWKGKTRDLTTKGPKKDSGDRKRRTSSSEGPKSRTANRRSMVRN